jgi:endonuclease YncB( thermonuclease family)
MPAAAATVPKVAAQTQNQFQICVAVRDNCVVDGDTLWFAGAKIRIADIDAPEVTDPRCDYEKQLGEKATFRLLELLNEGPFEVRTFGDRETDTFGRDLRILVRDNQSLGQQLVDEGLARQWTGRREPWC